MNIKNIIDLNKRYFFHFKKNGLKGLIKYYYLNKFNKHLWLNKKLKWDNLGFWKIEPMPTKDELDKFYSELYWVDNHYYKTRILIERDLYHYNFLLNKIPEKLMAGSTFLNFGAGHGGISYLFAARNMEVFNIEPSEIFSGNLVNFKNFLNLDIFLNAQCTKKIDLIYSSHTLEHLQDPIEFFKSMNSILKEDGKIFLEIPNCRRNAIPTNYTEGGCDGKIADSHLLYFTKDFFEKIKANIFFFNLKEEEIGSEDNADVLRVILSKKDVSEWLNRL